MPIRMVGGLLARVAAAPRRSVIVLVAGATIGLGGVTALQGCRTIVPIIDTAISVCINAIRSLANRPIEGLPPGFGECGQPVVWNERGHEVKFCFFCNPADPLTIYMQLNCDGPYYPLTMRAVGSDSPITVEEGLSLEKMDCREMLLARARSTFDQATRRVTASFASPNDRIFPNPSAYTTLAVTVDGLRISAPRDFKVGAQRQIVLSGDLDEVAHYAMIAGLREIAFRDGNARYQAFLNRDVSAMMLFKNGACVDERLLFAPEP